MKSGTTRMTTRITWLFLIFLLLSGSSYFIILGQSLPIPSTHYIETNSTTEILRHKALKSTIYVIRHGEKPENGSGGLSRLGLKRAECVANLFGPKSNLNITYIMAAPPSGNSHSSSRSIETAEPLAEALNLPIDSDCDNDDAKCVVKHIRKELKRAANNGITNRQNILLIWRHSQIKKVLKELGVHHPPDYPDSAYDIIFQVLNGRVRTLYEHCPGIDDLPMPPPFNPFEGDDELIENELLQQICIGLAQGQRCTTH
ncbi:hypothetical protein Clacol_006125 [Clathrus columnatus]|uniref:Phosphoglycerate mutase family protein n=1 Tax=Clathrus columnatus TaxID=1419009 RepID=A0AAV5ADU6_9AGAM|nr:hypothetical protein Clacol_006125 [Clathrus columnatus]